MGTFESSYATAEGTALCAAFGTGGEGKYDKKNPNFCSFTSFLTSSH